MRHDPKQLAEESQKTRKAREKLHKKHLEVEKQMTEEALKDKTAEIHRWIERHAHQRVVLKNKNICLFDENQNTAEHSPSVASLAEDLKSVSHIPTDD